MIDLGALLLDQIIFQILLQNLYQTKRKRFVKLVCKINKITITRGYIKWYKLKVVLEQLTQKLGDFESVSKGLQSGGVNRVSYFLARGLFDDLLEKYEIDQRPLPHLYSDGNIVNNKHFENGIYKVQAGLEHQLTNLEKNAIKIFKKPLAAGAQVTPAEQPRTDFFRRYKLINTFIRSH